MAASVAVVVSTPPKAPKPSYNPVHKTRWEKEKIAAGDEHAFDCPDDPEWLGNWQLGEMVGKGASGRVKIARHKVTGELAAVKILPKGEIEKQRMSVEREIVMMKLMNHENVLKLYDVWEGTTDLYLIFEFVKGGELFDYIVNHGRLAPLEALAWFRQIISGIAYTHSLGVSHRDLKPENLLIASIQPPLLKIADWGMAAFTPPSYALYTSCGSPHYASPQIVNGEPYDGAASDIWSCGVILFALLTGRLPFDDRNVKVLLTRVRSGKFEMPTYVHPLGQDLIKRMLVVEVENRISMEDIMNHPFMSPEAIEYNNNSLIPPSVKISTAPSMTTLANQLHFTSESGIDEDIMRSLRIIWRDNADSDLLRRELMSPERNQTKAFYWLLDQYREQRLERYGMEDEFEDGFLERVVDSAEGGGPRPYQLVLKPKSTHHHHPLASSPAVVGLDSLVLPGTPPRLSSMSSTLAALEMLGKDKEKERQKMEKAPPRPPSPSSSGSVYAAEVAVDDEEEVDFDGPPPPAARVRTPKLRTVSLGQEIEMERERLKKKIQELERIQEYRGRVTAATGGGVGVSSRPRGPRARSGVSVVAEQPPQTPTPTSTPTQTVVFADSSNQRIGKGRLVSLGGVRDARRSSLDSGGGEKRSSSATTVTPSKKEREEDKENYQPSESNRTPKTTYATQVQTITPRAGNRIRSNTIASPVQERRANLLEKRISVTGGNKEKGKRPPELQFTSPPLVRKSSFGMPPIQAPTPIIPIHSHRARPAPAHANTAPSTSISSSRPQSPSVMSISTPVTGFLANLFHLHFKPQTFVLWSLGNVEETKRECERLMGKWGVIVDMVANGSGGTGTELWRCWARSTQDGAGPLLIQKEVRFRIEFTPSHEHPHWPPHHHHHPHHAQHPQPLPLSHLSKQAAQPSSSGPNPRMMTAPSASTCRMTLIQERGALSTFKMIYQLVKDEWRLDTVVSTPVTAGF